MQNIPISLAKAGMVLAKEIKNSADASAMTICGKGIKLTEPLIDRLQRMGIQSLVVEGHPVHVEGEASLEEMLTALDRRFSSVEDDPLMMKIKDIYRKQIQRAREEPDAG